MIIKDKISVHEPDLCIKEFLFPPFSSTGDQVGPEDSQEVLLHPPAVVQVPAPSLLRPVVHLSASVREGVPLQGAGTSHRLRRPQEDAGEETAAP